MSRGLAAAVCLAIALSASASAAKPKIKRKSKTSPASSPKAAAPAKAEEKIAASPGRTTGEIANTDIFKRTLSLRSSGAMRDFAVPEDAKIAREVKGKPDEPLEFEAVQVGDLIDVISPDGKIASGIRVRAR
jgi:hypothetical protein